MLRLVGQGAKTVFLRTEQVNDLGNYLTEHFPCEEVDSLYDNYATGSSGCIIGILTGSEKKIGKCYQISQTAESVLGELITSETRELIAEVITPPPAILFNSLGETQPVIEKIQREFQAELLGIEEITKDRMNGALILFLESDGQSGKRLARKALFVRQDYDSTLEYLKIHAPRYLAKAFEPNVWHMVDLRIYDRYEAYDLQYQRLIYAIQKLHLGYIVSENWNREISNFSEPTGTYGIRLLTFLEPLQLKKALMGLEYGREAGRIVDLDIFWHGKKLSWKNVLDDKETRKEIKDLTSFFPKSNFFAIQNEKAALIKFCIQQLDNKLSEEESNFLKEMERQIRNENSHLEK